MKREKQKKQKKQQNIGVHVQLRGDPAAIVAQLLHRDYENSVASG